MYRLHSLLFYLLVSVAEIHLRVQGYVPVSPVVYFAVGECVLIKHYCSCHLRFIEMYQLEQQTAVRIYMYEACPESKDTSRVCR